MDTAYRVSPLRSGDPASLGDYQLVGRLGAGGMGVVYLAEDADGTYVAIKLIHAELASDPEFSGRFRSEVQRARQVPPFCTAEFVDADLDHDPPYLVVEYVDGPSLEEVVAERGPLRGGALHSLAVGVATALTGIHGAGVIHRDLKPDNVLLPPGSPKVVDFGIARPLEATSRHTRTDFLVGTVSYMAPERLSNEPGTPVTPAADVFAWGCVIAYAGTGRTPFAGDSPAATAGRILTQPPRLDGLPEPLRGAVLLALAKDPADRPTAPDLLAMLLGEKPVAGPGATAEGPEVTAAGPEVTAAHPQSTVAGPEVTAAHAQSTAARPEGTAPPRRRRVLLPAVVAALLLLTGLGAGGLLLNRDADPLPTSLTPTTTAAGASASAPAPAPATPSRSAAASPSAGPSRSAETRDRDKPTTSSSASPSRSAVSSSANPDRRNLALGRAVTASSTEGPAWGPGAAVDGDRETRWGSGFSDPQWLTVDLGARWQISEIVLRWERAHAVAYRVEVSTDGTRWKSVYSTSAGQGGAVRVSTDQVPGRYVRMYGTQRSGSYGYSLYEIEVR